MVKSKNLYDLDEILKAGDIVSNTWNTNLCVWWLSGRLHHVIKVPCISPFLLSCYYKHLSNCFYWWDADKSYSLTYPPLDKMAAILADDIFKCIFVNDNDRIPIQISLKFVPMSPIDNKPALVQVMAWRRIDDNPLPEPMMTQFTNAYMRH